MKYPVLYYYGFLLLSFSLSFPSLAQITTTENTSTVDSCCFVIPPDSLPEIRHKMGRYFIERRKLQTLEVLDRLGCVDATAFKMFSRGKQMQKIGGKIALTGLGIYSIGGLVAMAEAVNNIFGSESNRLSSSTISLLAVGGALSVSGATIFISGKIKKNNAVKVYNHIVQAKSRHYTLYARPSANKFSLVLKF